MASSLSPPPLDGSNSAPWTRWLQQLWEVVRGTSDVSEDLGAVMTTKATQTLENKTLTAESWTEVTAFLNSWTNTAFGGYNTAGYMKDPLGWVHLKGLIKSGAMGSSAFLLPAGYRPAKNHVYAVASSTGGANIYGGVDIGDSGNVVPFQGSNAGYVSLDGISFRAA
jgi:hypothetical protein